MKTFHDNNCSAIIIDDDKVARMVTALGIKLILGIQREDIPQFQYANDALVHIEKVALTTEKEKTLIFLDLEMPIMNGYEFLAAFSELPEATRSKFLVIVVSSTVDDRVRVKLHDYKCFTCAISKEHLLAELGDAVEAEFKMV